MFGNTFVNYGGPGGVRRGLIWQSGGRAQRDYRGFWYNTSTWTGAGGGYNNYWKMIPTVLSRSDISNPYPWPFSTTIGTDPTTGDPFLTIVAFTKAEKIDIDFFYDPVIYDLPIDPYYPDFKEEIFPDGSVKHYGLSKEVLNYPKAGSTYESRGGCVLRIKGSFIHVDNYFSCHRYSGLQNVALPVKDMTDFYDNMLQDLSYPSPLDFGGCKYNIRQGTYYNMPMPEFDEAPNTQQSRIYYNLTQSAPDLTGTDPYDVYAESRRTVYMDSGRSQDAQLYVPYQLFFSTAMDTCPTDEYSYRDYMDYPRTETESDAKKRIYLAQHQQQPLFNVPFINFPRYGHTPPASGKPFSTIIYPLTGQYTIGNAAYGHMDYATLPATDISKAEQIGGLYQFSVYDNNDSNSIRCVNMYNSPYYTNFNDFLVDNVSERLTVQNIPGVTGNILQPSLIKGEKYLCNVSPSAATYRTNNIESNPLMWSGRYKFLGFKGTISFFEKR